MNIKRTILSAALALSLALSSAPAFADEIPVTITLDGKVVTESATLD